MTTQKPTKPRELFLSKHATEFCNTCGGATAEDDPMEPRIRIIDRIIEYSAYQKAVEALRFYAKVSYEFISDPWDNLVDRSDPAISPEILNDNGDVATQALKDLGELE